MDCSRGQTLQTEVNLLYRLQCRPEHGSSEILRYGHHLPCAAGLYYQLRRFYLCRRYPGQHGVAARPVKLHQDDEMTGADDTIERVVWSGDYTPNSFTLPSYLSRTCKPYRSSYYSRCCPFFWFLLHRRFTWCLSSSVFRGLEICGYKSVLENVICQYNIIDVCYKSVLKKLVFEKKSRTVLPCCYIQELQHVPLSLNQNATRPAYLQQNKCNIIKYGDHAMMNHEKRRACYRVFCYVCIKMLSFCHAQQEFKVSFCTQFGKLYNIVIVVDKLNSLTRIVYTIPLRLNENLNQLYCRRCPSCSFSRFIHRETKPPKLYNTIHQLTHSSCRALVSLYTVQWHPRS